MATEKQIAANHRNSRKCTGPKTNEGKSKSSLNALRHCLYSHNYIIKTEDAAVFENFSKSFIDEFKPSTPAELENLKVLIIAACRRIETSQDRKIRNETNFAQDRLAFAA